MQSGVLAAALLMSPAALHAQAAPERTGPLAAPQTPAFAQPAPGLARAATDGAQPAPAAGGMLTQIRIVSEGPHVRATPPRAWSPPAELGASLRLEHSPDQDLDEAWVRRQFELNGLGNGGAVGPALALTQLINRAFLGAGFINSGLVVRPSPAPGVLELQILYGGLAAPGEGGEPISVQWAGDANGLTLDYVRDRLPAASRRPLSAVDLERDFRLLAEDPAIRTVNADLRPGSRPGEASLALSIYPQDRHDLYITVANDRSPSVGGERVSIGGHARNGVVAGDILTGGIGLTKGVADAAVGYAAPFFDPRTTISARVGFNNAAVIDRPVRPLDIRARERSGEIGLTHKFIDEPLLPGAQAGRWAPARTFSGGVLLARRVSTSVLQGEPFSFAAGSVDGRAAYTAVRLVGDYLVRGVDQVFAVSVTASKGLGGTRSDAAGALNPKKHFSVALAQVNYARRLSDKGLELRARLAGQIADSILYSGERFSAGGATSVRGYRENLLLADEGIMGSLELAQPISFSRRQVGAAGFDWGAFSVSAFVDAASLKNRNAPQPDGPIYSVGASLAWTPSEALSAQLTYGESLSPEPPVAEQDIQDDGVHFRMTFRPLRW